MIELSSMMHAEMARILVWKSLHRTEEDTKLVVDHANLTKQIQLASSAPPSMAFFKSKQLERARSEKKLCRKYFKLSHKGETGK